ncbi:hypothetical protein TGRUB_431210 [Toxoplasma gondii RUB]|uniref:Uncharacterized protein n=1 Tax=Toxoplasma gondii RUB TaxID=935652 RepID=A0A086LYZ5_TOXGO|nr:hypothetical protein TGRUB_431210 [Toxoplasma gondii RUB]
MKSLKCVYGGCRPLETDLGRRHEIHTHTELPCFKIQIDGLGDATASFLRERALSLSQDCIGYLLRRFVRPLCCLRLSTSGGRCCERVIRQTYPSHLPFRWICSLSFAFSCFVHSVDTHRLSTASLARSALPTPPSEPCENYLGSTRCRLCDPLRSHRGDVLRFPISGCVDLIRASQAAHAFPEETGEQRERGLRPEKTLKSEKNYLHLFYW